MKLRLKQRIEGPIVPLGDDFVVNLDGLAHFAKFDVSLKVDKATKVLPPADGGRDRRRLRRSTTRRRSGTS